MTEKEWLASSDPAAMLRLLNANNAHIAPKDSPLWSYWKSGRFSIRKLRLWVGALYSISTHTYNDTIDIVAWRKGEMFAGESTHDLLYTADCWATSHFDYNGDPPMALRAELLRDIAGNPYRSTEKLFTATPLIASLAQAAYDSRNTDGTLDTACFAVLADALLDTSYSSPSEESSRLIEALDACWCDDGRGEPECASCQQRRHRLNEVSTHPDILTHLRSHGPHVCGCWALDLFLGRK